MKDQQKDKRATAKKSEIDFMATHKPSASAINHMRHRPGRCDMFRVQREQTLRDKSAGKEYR